jgi:hypothetical protein
MLMKDNEDYKNLIRGSRKNWTKEDPSLDEEDALRRMLNGSSMSNSHNFRKVEFEVQAAAATAANALKIAH